MKAVVFSVAALLTALLSLSSYHYYSSATATSLGLRFDDKCPEALAVECIASVQISARDCEKALKDRTDVGSDVKCIQGLMDEKKVCWPCICDIAKKYVKVEGCD